MVEKEIKELKEDGARSEDAPPVVKKILKKGTETDPLRGLAAAIGEDPGKPGRVSRQLR